jgi:hypothetical protein
MASKLTVRRYYDVELGRTVYNVAFVDKPFQRSVLLADDGETFVEMHGAELAPESEDVDIVDRAREAVAAFESVAEDVELL